MNISLTPNHLVEAIQNGTKIRKRDWVAGFYIATFDNADLWEDNEGGSYVPDFNDLDEWELYVKAPEPELVDKVYHRAYFYSVDDPRTMRKTVYKRDKSALLDDDRVIVEWEDRIFKVKKDDF